MRTYFIKHLISRRIDMNIKWKLCALLIVAIAFSLAISCAYRSEINPEDSYIKIKPIAPLAEYEQQNMPHNLIVKIENVADMNDSYKNRVQLYVNNYRVKPDESYNFKEDYQFKVKLQPGVYRVKAKYYAYSGWKEEDFTITTREDVKVYLDKIALLTVRLKKNHWGAPVDKKTYFNISYEPLN